MKFWTIHATSIDTDKDIPYSSWNTWSRKSLNEAESTWQHVYPDWAKGTMRRLLMVEHTFDCETGVYASAILKSLRHPTQKKVIYNQQVKKEKPVEKQHNPVNELDWAALAAIFKQNV